MIFPTAGNGGKISWFPATLLTLILCLGASLAAPLRAAPEPGDDIPGPGQIAQALRAQPVTNTPATNTPAAAVVPAVAATPGGGPPVAPVATAFAPAHADLAVTLGVLLAALITLGSVAGFLLYQCGLTRAKNSGHTATVLFLGVVFALTGYWIGGFAVQMGGVGDVHAALMGPLSQEARSALDHELSFLAFGHHWNFMGNSGFFLMTDDASRNGIALMFLLQAPLLAVAVAASLGGALERARVVSAACCAFLLGFLVYPLLANWIWGGGWLAALGDEFHLGNGFVDVGGAEVIHLTAGIFALVLAIALGPRHGRFRGGAVRLAVPGHNVPFILFGSLLLVGSWMTANAFAAAFLSPDPMLLGVGSSAGLAAIDTLLAAVGGVLTSLMILAWRRRRPEPAPLCRGLLGGAVASCGSAGLVDPWAAIVIGAVAGPLVQAAVEALERRQIDDPAGAAAVHGAGGAWGVVATGLFANGSEGLDLNGVPQTVRGLFFGGAWHQLAAQLIGLVVGVVFVALLGYLCVALVGKILGLRAGPAEEDRGLDWSEVGALGYQGDIEPED